MNKLGSGVFGDVFASSNDTVIKKVKLGSGIGSGLDKARHERDVLIALAEYNLPIPQLLWYSEFEPGEHPEGYCAELTLSRLPGAAGSSKMILNADMARNATIAMRDLQVALAKEMQHLPLKYTNIVDELLAENLPYTDEDRRLFESIRPFVQLDRSVSIPVHGDFNITNILFTPESVSVIDFAEVMPGYAEDDLAAVCDEIPEVAVKIFKQAFEDVYQRPIDPRAYTAAWLKRNLISYVFDRYKENDQASALKREAAFRSILGGFAPSVPKGRKL